ncbi:hypothetical protein L2E82_33628 [Cichorium intybus]|uniref:Uncharacterized protein n=1 Tax=Cichorium intybus TaxID=13427 RepID=A0ACB9BKZ5_CICIN|nr:hypothetical protein L2E82_33628 [Cichorium intybus]
MADFEKSPKKSKSSPRDFSYVLSSYSSILNNTKITEDDRMRLFIENFEDCMQDSDYLLHQIRLLIIPVVQHRHIYMVAVDIKDADFVIIDNSNFVQEISARYGQLPALLKRYLVDYLCSVSHPIADALSVIVKAFDTGFKRESKAQQLQLDRLRVKYLYTILTNENNLRKAAIENEVLEYMKIPAGDRKQIKENAAANIHERLAPFG